jgi:hypothetical protein
MQTAHSIPHFCIIVLPELSGTSSEARSSSANPALRTDFRCTETNFEAKLRYDWRPVSMSWCPAFPCSHDQMFVTVWRLLLCLCGAPSLTKGRVCLLSVRVCSILSFVSTHISIYISDVKRINLCSYTISKAFVSPVSVQQFMPYYSSSSRCHGSLRHLNRRARDRCQF